jgi:multiple sugar transport system ATP-binding protein
VLDLTQHLDRSPANLSGGQRQRVAMGRAIVRDPQVFLMDEPLSNLDAKLRVQTRTEVSKLQKRLGTTMVYVTHDQTEAMTLGDRLAVMRSGILQQVGSPHELYANPVNLFVAGFIGSPAMNFMAGTLEEGGVSTSIGRLPLSPQLRQALESGNSGRQVIVGIRPEDFEDASLVQAADQAKGVKFRATIDVVESMGSDVFIYFTQESGLTAKTDQLATWRGFRYAELGSAETVTARLDPTTRIKEGDSAELWADVSSMHIFDPDDGRTSRWARARRAADLQGGPAGLLAVPDLPCGGAR